MLPYNLIERGARRNMANPARIGRAVRFFALPSIAHKTNLIRWGLESVSFKPKVKLEVAPGDLGPRAHPSSSRQLLRGIIVFRVDPASSVEVFPMGNPPRGWVYSSDGIDSSLVVF